MSRVDEYTTQIERNIEPFRLRNPALVRREELRLEKYKPLIQQEIILTETTGINGTLFSELTKELSNCTFDSDWVTEIATLILTPRLVTQSIETFLIAAFEGKTSGRHYKDDAGCKCWHGYKVPDCVSKIEDHDGRTVRYTDIVERLSCAVIDSFPEDCIILSAVYTPIESVLMNAHIYQACISDASEAAELALDPEKNLPFLLFLQYLTEMYWQYQSKEGAHHVPDR